MAAELPVSMGDASGFLGALDPVRDRRATAGGVEERQLVRPEAERRNAERFQKLRCRWDVEQRLHPRTDHERLRACELAEVGRDVEPLPAMNTADPTRGHEAD